MPSPTPRRRALRRAAASASSLLLVAALGCASAPAPRAAAPTGAAQPTATNVAAPKTATCSVGELPGGPIDLVFVVDVSTSMSGHAALRTSIDRLFERVASSPTPVRIGLTTFENDVVLHGGARFLERDAFFEELDAELVPEAWTPNDALPRHLGNDEPEENILDALARSADWFDFGPDHRVAFVLLTDDTFLEPPAVFGDGTRALHRYAGVVERLSRRGITLHAVHAKARGRGLSAPYRGQEGLVAATGGQSAEIARLRAATLDTLFAAALGAGECAPSQAGS